MKKAILFSLAFFTMLFTTAVMAQTDATVSKTRTSSTGLKCCASFYVSYPGANLGEDPSIKLLTSNPFGGRNQGIDLTYDVLDPNGGLVPNGSNSVDINSNGDLIIDASKLPAGKRYRLRLKAGNDIVNFDF